MKTERNPKGSGRKPGVRSEKYNLALQDWLTGGGSVAEIAKKYGIDRSGLNKVINSTNKEAQTVFGTSDLRSVAVESKNAVIEGLKNLEAMKKSTNPVHQALADNIIEKIQETSLTLARNIQIIGAKLLRDLDTQTTILRECNKLTLNNIDQAFTALQKANTILGIPKAPSTQINIQNNNANISQTPKSQDARKEIRFVTIESKEDLNKVQPILEGEVIG